MSYILGMDTGGTYTDGVIIQGGKDKIMAKAKALTTKENLSIGIEQCIKNLDFKEFEKISLVSISTTLATNAIVEGRGAKVGLIYMGSELEEKIPEAVAIKVAGKVDIMGRLVEDINENEIRAAIEEFRGKVDSVAISGYAGVRNPKHEKQIGHWVKECLGIQAVCAYQLTSALGFHHRTVTAVLNASLIPIIDELINATKESLSKHGINAPLMIVRGDGSLMTEDMAKEKPIETILSGPAASITGGAFLTGLSEALVVDMGGTTTDIANISEGRVRTRKEGAKVGGWLTRVQAAEISTFGIGGDSRICLDEKGELTIGPQKVWPLCVIGAKYPSLIGELKSFRRIGEFKSYPPHEAEGFMLVKEPTELLTEKEAIIFEALKKAPHSSSYLATLVEEAPENLELSYLVEKGLIARIGFTPTDILHIQGRYNQWNRDISQVAAEIIAKRIELPIDKFVEMAERKIEKEIAMTCIQSGADFEEKEFDFRNSQEAMYLLDKIFDKKNTGILQPKISISKPIVAIGAPADPWIVKAGEYINAEVLIPANGDVANAIGAAVGQLTESIEVLVSVDGNQFILNLPDSRTVYATKEEVMFYAVHEGRKHIEHVLMAAGCKKWNIIEEHENIMIELQENAPRAYGGTRLKITGVGAAI